MCVHYFIHLNGFIHNPTQINPVFTSHYIIIDRNQLNSQIIDLIVNVQINSFRFLFKKKRTEKIVSPLIVIVSFHIIRVHHF